MATTRKPPPVLHPDVKITNEDGTPTREFLQWQIAVIAWAKQVDATIP